MLSSMLSATAILALLAPSVAAHGFVRRLGVDGTFYVGNTPNTDNVEPSPVRLVSKINPVQPATNAAVNCGFDAKPAALVVPANPRSLITFEWEGGDGSHWPHNIGPMMTYLALCGNTTCDKFDSADADWFKIDEVGKLPNNSKVRDDAPWWQDELFNGNTHTVGLPAEIKAGDYLIRHEILALHDADTVKSGGAEFYPSCSQLRIGGNGTAVPRAEDTVKLPGAYADNDPGILVPTIFNPGANYSSFPGPQIAQGLAAVASLITAPSNTTETGRKPLTAVPENAAASNSASAPSNATAVASAPSNATASATAAATTASESADTPSASDSASASSDAETSSSASSVATAASSASADADASSCSASGASSVPSASASASDAATSASAPTTSSAASSSASATAQEDPSYVRRHHARDFFIPADAWAADDDDAPDMPSLLW